MKLTTLAGLACLILALTCHYSRADMGRILLSDAQVLETAQKAIILHNGSEEVLILGTDIEAEQEASILRFIPFPSEPAVSLAPDAVFDTLSRLLADLRISFLSMTRNGPPETRAVDLLLHEKLGAHDMTVIKVDDPDQFHSWVMDYRRSRNLPPEFDDATLASLVEDYVNRGMTYFVLDYVELESGTRFIEPVQYRFASEQLYYPLKTSNTFGGQGAIDLFLFLPGTLCQPSLGPYDSCLGFTNYSDNARASTSSLVPPDDLAGILPDAADFFGDRPVFLQMFAYHGDYLFDRDILEEVGDALPQALDAGQYGDDAMSFPETLLLPAPDPRCAQVPDPGPCKGLFEKFYYDTDAGECRTFFYGGCDGSVPFDTEEECREACMDLGR